MQKLPLIIILLLVWTAPNQAQTAERPLIFPVAEPPGAATWMMGQPYGNTVGAFNFGTAWYSAGQGLHFGIDISMPCGTPLVAVADGEVMFIDDMGFGSGPHNLILRHAELGLTSLYGHLLNAPALRRGQMVRQGEVIATSGDPDVTCDSRPHLHLEVRSLDYFTTYNPVEYIDANWHSLAIIGSFGYPLFETDLDNARRWQTLEDQPDVRFGGARLNAYSAPYPPASNLRPPANAPLLTATEPLKLDAAWQTRRIGNDQCCWLHDWHPTDSDRLYVIDGAANQRASIYEWSASTGTLQFAVQDAPPAEKSPDGTYEIRLSGNNAVIRHVLDNTEYTVATGGAMPALSTDNTRLVWSNTAPDVPGGAQPASQVFVSQIDGSETANITSAPGASARWLDATRLLVSIPGEGRSTTLYVYDTTTSTSFGLVSATWMRGLSIAPGGGRIMYYTTFQPNDADSAIYTIATEFGAEAQKIPWFGGWRWRDANSLYYIPFDPTTELHTLHHYDLVTGEDTVLTSPDTTPFTIMNGDWSVSPDGNRILFHNGVDYEMTLLEMVE